MLAQGGAGQAGEEVVEVAPSTPEQECPKEEREINPAFRAEEAIRSLEALDEWASELLKAAGRRHVRDDFKRRLLDLMKMEVGSIIVLLKSSDSPLQDHDARRASQHWAGLCDLIVYGNLFLEGTADEPEIGFPCFLKTAILQRHRSYRWDMVLNRSIHMVTKCHLLEHAGKYRHLLSSRSSDIELPPQVAALGGAPLVGTDRSMNKLFRWLALREDSNCRSLSVMSIVGPAGIGKTALSTDLHNRLKCQATRGRYYFHCNVMVSMSWGTDERHKILLQDILSKISDTATAALPSDSDHSQPTKMDLLAARVSKRLRNKRYFICIEGMPEASDWDKINGAFPNNSLGSRILVTTRDGSIERSICSNSYILVHQMKPLSRLDSERLLLTRAFGSQLHGDRLGMSPSLIEFLDACGGIPLFIISLADLLKQHFPTDMWHSEEGQEEADRYEGLRRALYDNFGNRILSQFLFEVEIPYLLVMVLLYLSNMFSHGHKFERDSLIRKWISEGLARNSEEAQRYFSQLVDMNIITSTSANFKSSLDEAEAWQLHMNRFMQEFLASRSLEIGVACTDATLIIVKAPTLRRLVLHHSDPMTPTLPQKIYLSQIRSLTVSGAVDGVPLDKFAYLLVLDLEGWMNLTDEILRQVCTNNMTLLQHLSIRNTQVCKIPHEIKNLGSLRALDISYTQISELPLEMFELEFLRKMILRGTLLRKLPEQIVDRLGFRWLDTLDTIDLSEQPASFVKALGSLECLWVLEMTWSFHQCTHSSYREALLSSIKKWGRLRSLTIHCGLGCSMEFLDSLTAPPLWLTKFKVTKGRFASMPQWINKLDYLSFLQITICKQVTDDLKILGDLGHLQCLILGLEFIPGEVIAIGNEGFGKLERLSVDCPMPWLRFSKGAMRNLRYLQLKFRSIPARQSNVPSGLENLKNLTEVVLCYHERYANSPSVKMTVEAVKKQVANHPNPIDLFINGTEHDVQGAEEKTEWNSVATQRGTHAEIKDAVPAVDEELKIKSTCEIEEVLSDA